MVTVATAVGAKSKELGRLYNATYSDSGGAQTMRHILQVAVLGILVLIMVAACGGPSGTGSGAKSGEHSGGVGTTVGEGTTPEGAATQKTVVIKESEFKLDPSNITLDKPGTYIFEAKNIGTTTHALEIEGNGVEAETSLLDAGSSGKVKVELKKPGIYEMYCPVDGHRAEGMEGKITVK